jgi:putative acetyltransferase
MSAVALRPYLPADAKRCAEIFRASVEQLAADDYDEDQREAWASTSDDEMAFRGRLEGALTLIATIAGEAAGFGSLKDNEKIDMLYIQPDFVGRGAARTLIDALTRLAIARGAKLLTVDASEVSKPLFERLGFVAQKRNLVHVGDQWLANTTMTKTLGVESPPPTRH